MKLEIIKEYQQGEQHTEICLAHSNGDWIASLGQEGFNPQEKIAEEIVKRVNLHEELLNALKNFVEGIDIICEGLEDSPRRNVYLSIQQSLTYTTAKTVIEKTNPVFR